MTALASHDITLLDEEVYLDQTSIQDFVDLFFGGRPSKFIITVHPTWVRPTERSLRGRHRILSNAHVVEVFASTVSDSVELKAPVGGNNTVPRDVRHGVHLVLVHELRHGYQRLMYGNGSSALFNGKYRGRAGEIDARRHVDENALAIDDFIG